MKICRIITLVCLLALMLLLGAGTAFAEETASLTAETDAGVNITATTALRNNPTFTVNIPQSIPLGNLQRAATDGSYANADFSVSVSNVTELGDKTVQVKLSTADGAFMLYNGAYALPYEVKKGDSILKSGDVFAAFSAEEGDAVSGKIVVDRYDIAAEGVYTGILIFTVSVGDAVE